MDRAAQVRLLREGDVEVLGRVVGSSNQALLVAVSLDGETGNACYKSEAGERPLWDFPDGLWRREVAAYELDVVLGTDLVPTTVGRDDLPYGPGSLQWWVGDNGEDHYFTLRDRPEFADWFAGLAAFDVVANNADRKSGHVLYDETRLWAIDNGLCFHEQDKLRTVVWEYAGLEVAPDLIERLDAFARGAGDNLAEWLSPHEVASARSRARGLVASSEYPTPDEDRDWPPYPWPLV
ncbi:MAG TPA: phosphatidylinositol kinase [Acidimicrobiales bacterium]|nr:phosphatidylinositol kinase [Acidimicrobiales bacterium]